MKTKKMSFANVIGALCFLALGVYALIETLGFKKYKNSVVGPEAFPRIMALGLIVCCAVLIVQSLLHRKKANDPDAPSLSLRMRGMRHMLLCAILAVAFVALWEPLGFLILTPVVMFALMYLIDMRNYKVMALVAVGLTLIVWLLFYKVLSISVPIGPLEVLYDFF